MKTMKTVAKWALYLICCFGVGVGSGFALTWLADVLDL